MAKDIDLITIPKVKYPALRQTVQAGDLLFYSGEDEVSRLIRRATQSLWSHIGIIFKIENLDRILLLESVESMGVRLIPVSRYIKNIENEDNEGKYDARLVIARHQALKPEQVNPFINFGIDQISRPYDLAEIKRIIERIQKGKGKIIRDESYMCSELVYECFAKVGIEIPYNELGFISPQDIWIEENIQVVAEIDHLSMPKIG
jgi:uncharacterized protein YycO